jgi:molybdopterin molybdotransferase
MLELEDALERILAATPPPQLESLRLPDADRRVLGETITAPEDLPPFENSAVDGYAVRAADVAAARPEQPVRLRLVSRLAAGQFPTAPVGPGECARIFTGSPVPPGADAVVMQEVAQPDPAEPGCIVIRESVTPGENVRHRGEDVPRGRVLAQAGERLTPFKLALLSAAGVAQVRVGRRPRVALLATGSELCEPGAVSELPPGHIFESNRTALAALVARAGGVPRVLPLVPDAPDALATAMQRALNECDILVTSGGVSVGEFDYVKAVFEQLGGVLTFWKIAMKPGRPFVFGRRGGTLLFGLPGNPVSALVTFWLLVRPALWRWQGAREVAPPSCPGELAEPLVNDDARRHFVRVRVEANGCVVPAGRQASHLLHSLAASDGLVEVPPRTTLPKGARVRVLRWD